MKINFVYDTKTETFEVFYFSYFYISKLLVHFFTLTRM